ncbi:MAG: hypothetical protein A2W35_08915 [Chloroflexi bacterium RBG_16_57_11]|nr:MAG: hypothetical protein A2W35_08915 [Chloroflexi bacterium RBG_16_57_11]
MYTVILPNEPNITRLLEALIEFHPQGDSLIISSVLIVKTDQKDMVDFLNPLCIEYKESVQSDPITQALQEKVF